VMWGPLQPEADPSTQPVLPIDVDEDPATSNSSDATLDVGGDVVWAGLYWSGRWDPDGASTGLAGDPRRSARFTTPSGATTVVAADSLQVDGAGYQAAVDVTDLVTGPGRYRLAQVAVDGGPGAWGAWTLVVVTGPSGGADPSAAGPPLVVTSPFRTVDAGATGHLDLGGPLSRRAAALAVDLVAYGGEPNRAGTAGWSHGGAPAALDGRSGLTGEATARLDHERFTGTARGYGALELAAAELPLRIGVVVASGEG